MKRKTKKNKRKEKKERMNKKEYKVMRRQEVKRYHKLLLRK